MSSSEFSPPDEQQTVFDLVGGTPFFERLVDRFYAGVANDPILLPLYPDQSDLTGAKERLTLFLQQYWGGPTTYSDERGHPRLRMRHVPFAIGEPERAAWLRHMLAAVEAEPDLDPQLRQAFDQYFEMAAQHLVNR